MNIVADQLIRYLEGLAENGRTHVFLDEEAKEGLRGLLRRRKQTPVPTSAPAEVGEVVPAVELAATSGSKPDRLAALRKQAESWPPARKLGTLRETMVFAVGSSDARLMLVGEAPGYEEEKRREPFVGPAGKKLDDILKAMGLAREEVYISNIVKFRPATKNQTTNNRKPSREEMDACLPFVMGEIGIVKPACIVALGGTAAEGLLNLSGTVGSMRETWHEVEGIPTRVTYHPSYLLQSGANNNIKRQLWEDMLEVMALLELPISEKQLGFFLPKA